MHKRRTREAESTDASIRRGLPHSSDDAGVMLAERRGQVTGVGMEPTCKGRSPNTQWKTAVFARWHEPDEARVSRPESVSGSGGSSPGRLGGGAAMLPPIPISLVDPSSFYPSHSSALPARGGAEQHLELARGYISLVRGSKSSTLFIGIHSALFWLGMSIMPTRNEVKAS